MAPSLESPFAARAFPSRSRRARFLHTQGQRTLSCGDASPWHAPRPCRGLRSPERSRRRSPPLCPLPPNRIGLGTIAARVIAVQNVGRLCLLTITGVVQPKPGHQRCARKGEAPVRTSPAIGPGAREWRQQIVTLPRRGCCTKPARKSSSALAEVHVRAALRDDVGTDRPLATTGMAVSEPTLSRDPAGSPRVYATATAGSDSAGRWRRALIFGRSRGVARHSSPDRRVSLNRMRLV